MMKASVFQSSERGAVLVTTLIVVAVLAVAAAALVQNTLIDRVSSRSFANHYRAQLAAEAGLGEALASMRGAISDFGYISGAEPTEGGGYRTFVQRRTADSGVWRLDGDKFYLDSGAPGGTGILVSGNSPQEGVVAEVRSKNLSASAAGSTSFAFWVDEAGAKQNLSWWGGPASGRELLTNATNIPLMLPSPDGRSAVALGGQSLEVLQEARFYQTNAVSLGGSNFTAVTASNRFPSIATINLVDESMEGRATRYFFTLRNPAAAATPRGGFRLNLQGLRRYLANGLSSTAQGTTNARSQLVDQLLQSNPTQATNWGGGDLSWLATSGRYSAVEQKQIVANLIDYLDDDLIPTTDSQTAPTYFGVEMKADSAGNIIGHPFINFITAGLIFNRQTGTGQVNSTRVLCSLGLVFPWSSTGVSAANYTPEINITMEGAVLNGIPGLGEQAGPYFRTNDLSDQISSRPIASFTPRSGHNWPQAVGLAGNASYATPFYGFTTGNWPARGPTNMTFQNARYVINKLRLRYTPTGGGAGGFVQILPTNMTIDVVPATLLVGGVGPLSLLVKFSDPGGAYAQTANLYLNNDPRTLFLRSSWTNLPSMTSFATNIPAPAAGVQAVDLMGSVGPDWDGAQGLSGTFGWYLSPAVTNHFSRLSSTNFQSVGELGYLWTGKPWQTLNVGRIRDAQTDDWNLLDYVQAGRVEGTNLLGVLPLASAAPSGPGLTLSNSLVADGGFNVNTRKLPTAVAVLTNAPGLDGDAAEIFAGAPVANQASAFGQLASMPKLVPGIFDLKFAREAVTRALGNVAVNQSRVFTVYSTGEFRQGNLVTRATIEADVFVDVDRASGEPRLKVLGKSYR